MQVQAVRRAVAHRVRSIPVCWWLWGIVFLGLILRFHAAGVWNATRPDSPDRLVGDEPGYNNLALALLDGTFFAWEGRVPLYPIWLAGVHWLTSRSYDAIPYVQSLLGLSVIPLTYLLGRRFFGVGTSLLAALLAAVSFTLIRQGMLLQSEILYTPALIVVTMLLVDVVRVPGPVRSALLGFAVGVSDLIRPTLLLFPLALAVLLMFVLGWRRGWRLAAISGGVTALVLLPWVVFGVVRHHAFYPLATSNALLWQGSPEYYHLIHDEGYTYHQIWQEVLFAPGDEEHWPHLIAGDRYWTKRALRSIRAEPGVYLWFSVQKAGEFWVGDPQADWNDSSIFDYHALRRLGYPRGDALQLMAMRILPLVALVSGLILRRHWRSLLPVYVLLAYATLLHAATHPEARLSDPFQPLLLILIAAAAVAVLARVRAMLRGRIAAPSRVRTPREAVS